MIKAKEKRIIRCPISECASSLQPSNAAVNFTNPALSITLAHKKGIINPKHSILEFGAGNLRNAAYLQRLFPGTSVSAYDLQSTIDRFPHQYEAFRRQGGVVLTNLPRRKKFDILVCTFVVETICPFNTRVKILRIIRSLIRTDGYLVASFRGYGGVRGIGYRICKKGNGLITPHRTFVKPHSIPELVSLMRKAGFSTVIPLQEYRVDSPENIHLIAR